MKIIKALVVSSFFVCLAAFGKDGAQNIKNKEGAAGAEKAKESFVANAQAKAASEKKTVLLVFSGLQWCPPCRYFEKVVLSTSQFKAFASKNLVVLNLDFPMGGGDVSVAIDGENYDYSSSVAHAAEIKELQEKYEIKGFPTALLLDKNGEVLFSQIGAPDGVKSFISSIKKNLKK